MLGVETWARTQPTATRRRNRKQVSQSQLRYLERESARWGRLVDEVEDRVDGTVALIHVMDSEADDYALLSQLVSDERRFVIRLCTDRRLAVQDDGDPAKLKQRLEQQYGHCHRTVKLSARRRAPSAKNKRNPVREERLAQLAFSATTVTLVRPGSCTKDKPQTLSVNIVYVNEVTPPDGHPAAGCMELVADAHASQSEHGSVCQLGLDGGAASGRNLPTSARGSGRHVSATIGTAPIPRARD